MEPFVATVAKPSLEGMSEGKTIHICTSVKGITPVPLLMVEKHVNPAGTKNVYKWV